jgi:hypothetical protein
MIATGSHWLALRMPMGLLRVRSQQSLLPKYKIRMALPSLLALKPQFILLYTAFTSCKNLLRGSLFGSSSTKNTPVQCQR